MRVFRDLSEVYLTKPTVLTIGTFDGLHQGHQYLLKHLKAEAKNNQAQSAVIAFHPRPKTVLAAHLAGNDYLTTPDERIVLFEASGLDILILIPFTIELSQTTALDFIKMLVERLKVVQFCVGHDFALGKNREGNVDKLSALGREFNYTVKVIEPFLLDGNIVSSTQIRQLLLKGDVRSAVPLLGRYPALTSQIVQGAQRGRTIGFPTANFTVPPERLIPANGVYTTFVRPLNNGMRLPSVTNVGMRPSFDGKERTVETFIFDFNENIYGQTLTLEFVERLRPEKKFNGIEELIAQINRDVEQSRKLLSGENPDTV